MNVVFMHLLPGEESRVQCAVAHRVMTNSCQLVIKATGKVANATILAVCGGCSDNDCS